MHSLFLLLLLIISVYFLNQIFYQEAHEDILTSPTLEEMLPEDLPVNSIKRTALEFASLKKKKCCCFVILGIEFRISCLLGQSSTSELHSQPSF